MWVKYERLPFFFYVMGRITQIMVPGKSRPQSAVAAVKSLSSGGFLQPVTALKELLCRQAGPSTRLLLTKALFFSGVQENAGPRGDLPHEQQKNPAAGPSYQSLLVLWGRKQNSIPSPLTCMGFVHFFRIALTWSAPQGSHGDAAHPSFLSAEMHLMSCVHFPRARPGHGPV